MPVLPVSGNQQVAVDPAGGRGAPTRNAPAALSNGALPAPHKAAAAPPGEAARRAAVEQAVESLRQHTGGALEFVVDGQRTIVKVVDKETNTVLRQMPSPEAIAISRALERMQGILIRLKA